MLIVNIVATRPFSCKCYSANFIEIVTYCSLLYRTLLLSFNVKHHPLLTQLKNVVLKEASS